MTDSSDNHLQPDDTPLARRIAEAVGTVTDNALFHGLVRPRQRVEALANAVAERIQDRVEARLSRRAGVDKGSLAPEERNAALRNDRLLKVTGRIIASVEQAATAGLEFSLSTPVTFRNIIATKLRIAPEQLDDNDISAGLDDVVREMEQVPLETTRRSSQKGNRNGDRER